MARAFMQLCRDFDIGDSVQCLRYYAGWADKIIGQVKISLLKKRSTIRL